MTSRNAPVPLGTPRPDSQAIVDRVHRAVFRDKFKTLMTLFESGVPVDLANRLDQSPLFCAAYLGRLEMCIFLLRWNADPNRRCVSIGCTPVHAACYAGNPRVLAALINAGGDLRFHDQHGRLPKEWAMLQNNCERRLATLAVIDNCYQAAMHKGKASDNLHDANDPKWFDSVAFKLPSRIRRTFNYPCCVTDHADCAGPLIRVQATGFGKLYYANHKSAATFAPIPTVSSSSLVDLDSLTQDNLQYLGSRPVSYRCGPLTDMTPRVWLNTLVTIRKARDTSYADMLVQEVQRIGHIRHPGVLTLLAVGSDPRDLFTPMPVYEPVQQGSLYHRLHVMGANMTQLRKLQILQQVCEALLFLHDSGNVHCSLTSHAIHLVTPYRAKIGCFETLCTNEDELRRVYRMAPTCHWENCTPWMAPELLRGEWPSCLSDIYAFCCVIWETFLEKVPWHPKSSVQISAQWDGELKNAVALDIREGLPTHIESVLEVGLRPDAKDREDIDLREIMLMLRLQSSESAKAKRKDSFEIDGVEAKEKMERKNRPLSFDEAKERARRQNWRSLLPRDDDQARKDFNESEKAADNRRKGGETEEEEHESDTQTIQIQTHFYRNDTKSRRFDADCQEESDEIDVAPMEKVGRAAFSGKSRPGQEFPIAAAKSVRPKTSFPNAEESTCSTLPAYNTFDEFTDYDAIPGDADQNRSSKFRWFFLNPTEPGIKPASHQIGKEDLQATGSYLKPNSYFTPSKWITYETDGFLLQGTTPKPRYAKFPPELRQAVALPPKLHENVADFPRPQWNSPCLNDSRGSSTATKRKPKKHARFSISRRSTPTLKKITFANNDTPTCSTPKKNVKKASFLACSSPWTPSAHSFDSDCANLTFESLATENGPKGSPGAPFANIRTGFVAATIAKLTGKKQGPSQAQTIEAQQNTSSGLDSLKDDNSVLEVNGLVDDLVDRFESLGQQ